MTSILRSTIQAVCLVLLGCGLIYAQCTQTVSLAGAYSLGPGNDGNQATGTGPFHLTATAATFSYVRFTPTQSFTFAQLASLSANFVSNSGGSGGGTPRLSVLLNDGGVNKGLLIYLGNSPAFTDTDAVLNGYSGVNLIGNNDAGRYDSSAFAGGSPFTTYAAALALVGSLPVVRVTFITDTFGAFPNRDETLNTINGIANVPCPPDSYQVRYASHLDVSDSYINFSNAGGNGAALPAGIDAATPGTICVNVYAFDPDEQLLACCSCPVTPNGLASMSVLNDIKPRVLTLSAFPTALVLNLVAVAPINNSCVNAAKTPWNVTGGTVLVPGLIAWGTAMHARSGSPVTYSMTETQFVNKTLSAQESQRMTTLCSLLAANGSGLGICNSCAVTGLSAGKK